MGWRAGGGGGRVGGAGALTVGQSDCGWLCSRHPLGVGESCQLRRARRGVGYRRNPHLGRLKADRMRALVAVATAPSRPAAERSGVARARLVGPGSNHHTISPHLQGGFRPKRIVTPSKSSCLRMWIRASPELPDGAPPMVVISPPSTGRYIPPDTISHIPFLVG